jgi:hypothetical protein
MRPFRPVANWLAPPSQRSAATRLLLLFVVFGGLVLAFNFVTHDDSVGLQIDMAPGTGNGLRIHRVREIVRIDRDQHVQLDFFAAIDQLDPPFPPLVLRITAGREGEEETIFDEKFDAVPHGFIAKTVDLGRPDFIEESKGRFFLTVQDHLDETRASAEVRVGPSERVDPYLFRAVDPVVSLLAAACGILAFVFPTVRTQITRGHQKQSPREECDEFRSDQRAVPLGTLPDSDSRGTGLPELRQ